MKSLYMNWFRSFVLTLLLILASQANLSAQENAVSTEVVPGGQGGGGASEQMTALEAHNSSLKNGFGGVWKGSTSFGKTSQDDSSSNVGSFFFSRVLGEHIYMGYAVSKTSVKQTTSDHQKTSYNEIEMDLDAVSLTSGYAELTPYEVNFAYLVSFWDFSLFTGAGVSLNELELKITQFVAGSIYSQLDNSYSGTVNCTMEVGGQSSDYTYGYQFLIGIDYLTSSMPLIGGNWSVLLQWKYHYIQPYNLEIKGERQCEVRDTDGTVLGYSSESKSVNQNYELTNQTIVLGAAYHF